MKTPRYLFDIVWAPDGRIFAIGGKTVEGKLTATVEMLESSWDTGEQPMGSWRQVAPLNHARAQNAAALIDGKIVVLGDKERDSVEFFTMPCDSAPEGQWTIGRPINKPLRFAGLLPFKGGLLAVGTLTFYNNCNHISLWRPITRHRIYLSLR